MRDQNTLTSICALMPYMPDTTPSQRYRVEQWLPYLQSQGISIDLRPFADDGLMRLLHKPGRRMAKAAAGAIRFASRASDVMATSRYDAVLIHRTASIAGPALLERLIPLFRRPLIYDFDDAIFMLHTTEANKRFGWLKFPGKTATICRLSAHVIVGNSYLAEYARRYNPRVTVIPSSVDTERYSPPKMPRANDRVVIGWMGSSTSQAHLELFAPVLRALIARRDVELRVVSDREPLLPGLPFTWRPWSAATEVEELAQFDIGIMPMPDDPWARGKCAMKALLYMSMGVATVCSAVGTNREVIAHGENGFLAATSEEWINQLESLIDDRHLRERLAREGRRTIEAHYSMQRCAEQFAQVVRQSIARPHTATNYDPSIS
ncbi:MAG TPA: glycosyltransferase family 4 protein [Blastocatellia bacterium]|jgi:glycosyltransferase involved in cell wall biosynthesis